MMDGYSHQLPDIDPQETREWTDSLDAVVGRVGTQRAGFLIARCTRKLQKRLKLHKLHKLYKLHSGATWASVRNGHRRSARHDQVR